MSLFAGLDTVSRGRTRPRRLAAPVFYRKRLETATDACGYIPQFPETLKNDAAAEAPVALAGAHVREGAHGGGIG